MIQKSYASAGVGVDGGLRRGVCIERNPRSLDETDAPRWKPSGSPTGLAHHREGACGRRPAAKQVTLGSCGRTELDPW